MFFSFNNTYHNFWRSSHDFRRSSAAFQLRPNNQNNEKSHYWNKSGTSAQIIKLNGENKKKLLYWTIVAIMKISEFLFQIQMKIRDA